MIARRLHILLLSFTLVACGSGATESAPAKPDDDLAVEAGPDPLLAAVVEDPIMTDPQLSIRSNVDAIRPPNQPYAAPLPPVDIAAGADVDGALMTAPAAKGACRRCAAARDAMTLGALVARQGDARMTRCSATLRYAAGWANRLPADLPLPASARVIEAAGADANQCGVRAVSFATDRPVTRLLDWYFTQASKAGYATEHQADDATHILAGSRARDGAAYIAFVRAAPGGGSAIDLLVNNGR